MQRWMQGKLSLAKSHGTTVSGAGRATGAALEDRPGRRGMMEVKATEPTDREIERHGLRIVEVSPVKRKVKGTIAVLVADRPVAWGKGRKARRAAANLGG